VFFLIKHCDYSVNAVLKIKEQKFEIVDQHGRYLLKPQHHIYPQMPENENIFQSREGWMKEIEHSFLSDEMKEKYIDVVESRFKRLNI
jgi:hypothetical protein